MTRLSAETDAVMRSAHVYGPWLELARIDDFIGVQDYHRTRIGSSGQPPLPEGAPLNSTGAEIYAASLKGAVRYAHQATGRPVLITEHGLETDDDRLRVSFIPAALSELKRAMDDGVPVLGYIHWSLLDNFEWYFGYRPHLGLVAVNRTTFTRPPKASAAVLGAIARRNAI